MSSEEQDYYARLAKRSPVAQDLTVTRVNQTLHTHTNTDTHTHTHTHTKRTAAISEERDVRRSYDHEITIMR